MKTINVLFLFFALLLVFPFTGITQEAEWIEQVIVVNGNKFESMPPFIDYVTVQTYNPATGVTSVFDEIKTQSTQDVIIYDQKIYVAAQDSIIMYDANTLQRLHAVADSGLSRLHVLGDWLIVTKQWPIVRFFVEVLNKDDLSIVARVQDISGDCKAIVNTKDSVYVAVYGGFLSAEGKLAVIDFDSWTLSREINFGPNALGINDLHEFGGNIFSVNESPYGSTDAGSITAYSTYSGNHTNYVLTRPVGSSGSTTKNSGVIGNMLYFTFNYGISSFNMETRQIEDTTIFPNPGSSNHIYFTSYDVDYVNSHLYMNIGDRISWGINLVGTTDGDSITSFTTGFNTDAIALDYRVPVGVDSRDSEDATIALFPNPVDSRVRIIYTGGGEVTVVLIRDMTGRTVYSNTEVETGGTWVDCSSYSSGLYFVTVKTEDSSISTKMIKR